MDRLDLTETIRLDTGIPFPHQAPNGQQQEPSSAARGETIVADICSEFTEYRAQVEYFKKNGLIRLVHDKDSLPIVFSLSQDQALCVMRHGTHQGEGWLCIDITPVDHIATTFDVVQIGDVLYIAAACKTSKDAKSHSLFHCTVDVSSAGFRFENEAVAQKAQRKGMQWTAIPDNTIPEDRAGEISITSILCKIVIDDKSGLNSFQIVTSTAEHKDRIATIYDVHTVGVDGRHWMKSSFPVSASLLVQTEPLILGQQGGSRQEGLVSVVRDHTIKGQFRCIGQRYARSGGFASSFPYKAEKLGNVRSAFSHMNIFGFTDVFITGENGIGFFSWQTVDVMSIEEPILPGISFKQVVVSEAEDPETDSQSKLSIFAVSNDDCLYFIEGTRDYSEVELKYKFEASGFPIRKGVTHLAARFNASHGTNELLYASSDNNSLFFLRRVSSGVSWIEDKITRRAMHHIKFDAFVSSIVLTDGHGTALPNSHAISITADSIHAVVNGKACSLSSQPANVAPDTTGCVLVAIPSASKLSCSPFTVTLRGTGTQGNGGKEYTFSIDPAQRVSRLLSNYDSPEKLRDARSSTGESVLSNMSSEQLDQAASLLSQYKSGKEAIENPENGSTQKAASHPDEDDSWFDQAIDGVEKFLSDAIEMVKNGVKTGVKLVIRVLGPVVKIALKIAGKIIKWVVKGIFGLLQAIGSGLELIFGYDGFSKFLEALKLVFDPKEIAKTQKFLSNIVTGGLKVASKAIAATKDGVLDAIQDGGQVLKQYLDDPRVPGRPFSVPEWIKKIFNNPLTRLLSKLNPLGWILEALYEEIPDLKVPDIGRLVNRFYSVFAGTFEGAASRLQQLWESLFKQILVVSSDPSKIVEAILNALKSVFWTFWDVATLIVEKTFDCLSSFLDELGPLLEETWNIPGLTDAWEDLTDQKFTLLGFITFAPAAIINMTFALTGTRMPKFGPVDFDSMTIEPFYKSATSSRREHDLQSTAEKGQMVSFAAMPMPVFEGRAAAKATPLGLNISRLPTLNPGGITSNHMNMMGRVSNSNGSIRTFSTSAQSTAGSKGDPVPEPPMINEKKDADDEEWAMPHWYQLVFADIGKTYSGIWNSIDSVVMAVADYKSYSNPQAPPVSNPPTGSAGGGPAIELGDIKTGPAAVIEWNGPPNREAASRWWIFFRGIGKVLQGGALIYGTVVLTRNTMDLQRNHTPTKGCIWVLGVMELLFFTLSVALPSSQEMMEICGDSCGSSGTVIRCIDDDVWDAQASCETTGSVAVAVMIVANQVKKADVEPMTKACLAGGVAACAVTDFGCSIFALYKGVERCAS